DSRRQRLVELGAKRDRGREAKRRANRLAVPARILTDEVPEVLTRLRVRQVDAHGLVGHGGIVGQVCLDRWLRHSAHSATSRQTARLTSGMPDARMCPW